MKMSNTQTGKTDRGSGVENSKQRQKCHSCRILSITPPLPQKVTKNKPTFRIPSRLGVKTPDIPPQWLYSGRKFE